MLSDLSHCFHLKYLKWTIITLAFNRWTDSITLKSVCLLAWSSKPPTAGDSSHNPGQQGTKRARDYKTGGLAGPSGHLRYGSRVSVTLRELSKFLGGPRWQTWWGFSAAHHAASNAGISNMLSPWCIPWRYKVGKLHRKQGHPANQVDWFWVRESHEEISLHNIVWYVLFPKSWQTCFGIANLHMRWNLFPSGTMEYYPPEYKIKGKYHGKSAVVWSLGVILFTMLCGRFPTSDDLHKTKLHLWTEPGLSKGEIFTTRKVWIKCSSRSNLTAYCDMTEWIRCKSWRS